jgi:hypothetical protein
MATIAAAAVMAGGAAYAANQQKKAAEKAAKGSQVTPWGPTGPYMEQLLGGAMDKFNQGAFKFGPAPGVYNAYLNFARGTGAKLPKNLNITPKEERKSGYGPAAYEAMLNMMQGPAWAGASQTNPQAMMGVQDPWAAGIMAGLGGYISMDAIKKQQQVNQTPVAVPESTFQAPPIQYGYGTLGGPPPSWQQYTNLGGTY